VKLPSTAAGRLELIMSLIKPPITDDYGTHLRDENGELLYGEPIIELTSEEVIKLLNGEEK
jgi:hypothetical protein